MAKLSMGLVAAAVLLVLAVFVQSGAALKCWSCNSLDNSKCGDDFDESKFNDVERRHYKEDCLIPDLNIRIKNFTVRPMCTKMITASLGKRVFTRRCTFENSEVQVGECPKQKSFIGGLITMEFCENCDSDECNAGSYLVPLVTLLVLPLLAIFRQ